VNRSLTLALVLALAGAALPARAQTSPTVVEIAASLHVLVLLSDGSVVALGENRSGQLGRPKAIRRFFPAERVPLPARAVQVAAGEDTSFALLDDGTVWAWGRGYYGTLGVDLKGATERHTPEAIRGLRGVSQIVADGNAAMALMADGTVRAWGALPASLTEGKQVRPGVSEPMPLRGLENIARLTGAPSMGFALTKDNRVIRWDYSAVGSLLPGGQTREPQPPTELPTLKDVVSIATVAGAAVAVTRDGRAWSWGSNAQAGLGNGLHGDTADAGEPTPQPVKGISDAVEVKAGSYGRHMIVRRRNGTLIGWGNSDWGQLGAGISGDHQPTPKAINLPAVEAYWLGGNFSFARTKDAMWFWGEQSAAQALLGVKGNQRVPAKVPMEKLLPQDRPVADRH